MTGKPSAPGACHLLRGNACGFAAWDAGVCEALSVETRHFADCIVQDATPLPDGKVGLHRFRILNKVGPRIDRIFEAATESLKQGGCPVQR